MKKTATETFIEKAIEGGYSPLMGGDKMRSNEAILLDPLAWQAVGTTEGWGTTDGKCNKCGSAPRSWLLSSPVTCPECRTGRGEWDWYMHRLIDALAEGKTIEEYLITLFV